MFAPEIGADAHEAIAMALIAGVLNHNGVYIEHGAVPIPMDFWLILLSESGADCRNAIYRHSRIAMSQICSGAPGDVCGISPTVIVVWTI